LPIKNEGANMDRIAVALAEVASATMVMHALTLLELDRRGLMSKVEFAALLKRQIAEFEANPPEVSGGTARTDLKVMRGVVGYLEGPPPKGWTPVVIDGGKA
jgi:hypothetical protein